MQPDAWTKYYNQHHVPPFIIEQLWKNYYSALTRHIQPNQSGLIIAELGGAGENLFADKFYQNFDKVQEYHVLDNNVTGLELTRQNAKESMILHEADLLDMDAVSTLDLKADIVFSAGLIEHFTVEDTSKMIEAHFKLVRPGGLVLLSFPTPTAIYWGFRWLLEKTNKFPPLFERPLTPKEVIQTTDKLGGLLESHKIWSTILTQQLILVRQA